MPTGKTIQPTPFTRIAPASEMSLTQLIDERLRGFSMDFNCHAIAKIASFNAAKQTCTATINYTKTYLTKNPDGTYSDEYVEYPVLADVPVVIMSGGNGSLTFPISPGDDCLILFNDRDIDNWFATGQALPLNSNRLHSMNDGIALVGIRAANDPIQNYDASRVVLKNGDAQLALSANKVKIANATKNLYTVLNTLLTAMQSNATNFTSPAGQLNPAVVTALTTAIADLGSLLE